MKTFSKLKTTILLKRIFLIYCAFYIIISIKYMYLSTEIDFLDYIFSFEYFGISSIVANIMIAYELFEQKTINYDEQKVCMYKSTFFSEKTICINLDEVHTITYRLGMLSVRNDEKVILLDNFTFASKDIKDLLLFLQQTTQAKFNPKMNKSEKLGSIFFLGILVLFYAVLYRVFFKP